MKHYQNSPYRLLRAVYDEYKFLPWLFHSTSQNYFDIKDHRKEFIDWLVVQTNVASSKELTAAHFRAHGGSGLLQKYEGSPALVLQSISDNLDNVHVDVANRIEQKENTNAVRRNFWVRTLIYL